MSLRCAATLGILLAAAGCRDAPNAPTIGGADGLKLGLQLVAEGMANPVYLTAPAGDVRLFIVERSGVVRVLKGGALLPTPFIDIRTRVNSISERGMLSMTFDPQYASNGFVYVFYTDANSNLVVERIASTPGSDVAGTESAVIITIDHGGENHHGGEIAFGPDGMLYLAPGDGGCCGDPNNNAQNLRTLLGKVLRIDVRTLPYTIPANNPYVGLGNARPEIWASGLRNPWRFSFDAATDRIYIADVGQDAREEIDVASTTAGGLNYGWRLMEGSACYVPSTGCNAVTMSLTLPLHEYDHTEGCSVIGGYVYRGTAIPGLTGHYLYSDFCSGWLRSFRATAGGAAEHVQWTGIVRAQTVSFGRDGRGELYMIGQGRVWRIVPA